MPFSGRFFLWFACAVSFATSSPALQAQTTLSKGHRILIERGLQIQGMVTPDDVFNLTTYSNAGYTSIHWLWGSNPSLMGPPPGFPWSRWIGSESNMPPQGGEAAFLPQLVSMQLGDEWDLNNPALRDRAVNWFSSIRSNYPNTIVYMNNFGGQVNDAALGDFTTRARPDMLCFDTYPWRSDYSTRVPLGGPPVTFYSDLRRYREHARAAGVPLACYIQTFHAVQDYDSTVYRDPSHSELRLNNFAAMAFNAKVLIDFTYNTGASSLFTTPGGDSNPTPLLATRTDINRRLRNLGRALVRLKPVPDTNSFTTSIMFIRGKNASGTPNPIPISFIADPQAPNSYTDWVSDRNDPFLRGWSVTNKAGIKNGGQPGDVILAWFKTLEEGLDGAGHTNEIYLMVVNGLSDPTGSAEDCLQEIKLNFAFPAGMTSVELLDPVTGQVLTQSLPVVSTRRQLVLNLNGGDAALFKFATGAPFVGWASPARLTLQRNGNVSSLGIQGAAWAPYRIESIPSLSSSNWSILTNFLLPSTPYVFSDSAASNAPSRFYRVIGTP